MRQITISIVLVTSGWVASVPVAEACHFNGCPILPCDNGGASPTSCFRFATAPGLGIWELADREQADTPDNAYIHDQDNKNGPAPDDARPIPPESDVPGRFRNLEDTLVAGAVAIGTRTGREVLDHRSVASTVESGLIVPTNYFLSNAGGTSRTPATSAHYLWFGIWDDANGDAILDEFDCDPSAGFNPAEYCEPFDEFIWRGANFGETLVGFAWFLPGEYDGSIGTGGHDVSSLDGSCERWGADNGGCVSPEIDMPYGDFTTGEENRNNRGWRGHNGGGQWTPEEFLLVSQHVVSIVGPASLLEDSAYGYKVECTIAEGCMRDYDWYQALAGDDVDDLYLAAMRHVRDEIEDVGIFTDALILAPCPWSVADEACGHDTRHRDAVADGDSEGRAYAAQSFEVVVPHYAYTEPMHSEYPNEIDEAGEDAMGPDWQRTLGCDPARPAGPEYSCDDLASFGAQGFRGEVEAGGEKAGVVPGGFVRARFTAWVWFDADGDGTIGSSDPTVPHTKTRIPQREAYEMGLSRTPNNGDCVAGSGRRCELRPHADVYRDVSTTVLPGAGGWPPGSALVLDYAEGPTSGGPHVSRLLSGTEPVTLRHDPRGCVASALACHTRDAILAPSGNSLEGWVGIVSGGTITVAWSESGSDPVKDYSVSFGAVFTA